MKFNADKCKVIHFGQNNISHKYVMGGYAPAGVVLEEVMVEKDVRVMVSEDLKPSIQCSRQLKRQTLYWEEWRGPSHTGQGCMALTVQNVCMSPSGVCSASLVPLDPARHQSTGGCTEARSRYDIWSPGLILPGQAVRAGLNVLGGP